MNLIALRQIATVASSRSVSSACLHPRVDLSSRPLCHARRSRHALFEQIEPSTLKPLLVESCEFFSEPLRPSLSAGSGGKRTHGHS